MQRTITLSTFFAAAAVSAFALTGLAAGAGAKTLDLPANDTYLDSYSVGTTFGADDWAHKNYGEYGAIKAVLNSGSVGAPFDDSTVRSLFTLPVGFLSDLAGNTVSTTGGDKVTLTYRVRNNTLNGYTPVLNPLTQGFVAGDGGNPTLTKEPGDGTETNSPVAHGADWNSSDGTGAVAKTWVGGAWDAAHVSPAGVIRPTSDPNVTFIDFDITNLVADATARSEISSFGLMLKLAEDPNPANLGNNFISLYSADTTSKPTITYVPEPASLGLLAACAATLTLRRRRSH